MKLDVGQLVQDHARVLERWYGDAPSETPQPADLAATIIAQHFCNFSIWNHEDQARRTDVPAQHIAETKRAIDGWNQRRNDLMEEIDRAVLEGLPEPDTAVAEQHSETAGLMIDRLSILALKIYHMRINVQRAADAEFLTECTEKVRTLETQRDDLAACLERLLEQCLSGQRYFRLYRQHKAYNDPRLNPALSGSDDGSS